MLSAVLLIYISGAVVLGITMNYNFWQSVEKGILPFIAVDIAKALLAGSISSGILPKD
jgi:biotin transporter BioY